MTLPQDFENMMTDAIGKEEYRFLADAIGQQPPTSIRINREKVGETLISQEHSTLDVLKGAERVPWCDTGFYLPERPQFTFDPLLHAGCYYVQEASSMFLAHILKQYVTQPVTALDLCAAPGGKSTLALSILPKGSMLIANEAMRQRANILAENIIKWGNPNCIVTNNYAEDFHAFSDTFDLIICDAPCSGEGMFRKDPASIDEWSLANVATCWKRQRDIAKNIWHTLKEGGIFIYSTCTYNPHEDEETVRWIADNLGAELLSCHPLDEWLLTDTNTHFFPHKHKGEGFFISVLRKTSASEQTPAYSHKQRKNKQKSKSSSKSKFPSELQEKLANPDCFAFSENNGTYSAFPTAHAPLLQQAKDTLKVIHSGIELATTKGKNLQPSHSLALSNSLNRQAFPTAEVDYAQAIAYLRTEALQLPADTPTGYVLITYKGHPLGFAKNIGNRANNLYPSEWKIKSTHTRKTE
ncbi:MAG: rRNA cytosine-C5-methyltransferase [Prevotellaceae bacterium]|nr:rRNA cytosine-C5-methyltransferase [Prevotellaceae bacterium]